MKIGVGVPTFNRRDLVRLSAGSIKESDAPERAKIIVIDDGSTEYDLDYLKEIYPAGAEVIGRARSTGSADLAAYDALSALCDRDFDLVICLDSDVMVSSRFVENAVDLVARTDGFCSLFNTPAHPTISRVDGLLVKNSVGNAAVAWKTELAREIIENVPRGENWDWRYSHYLRESGRRICCAENSLAQHLGFFQGQNARNHFIDVGAGFLDDSQGNAYRAIECLAFALQRHSRRTYELSDTAEDVLMHLRAALLQLDRITKEQESLRHEMDRLKLAVDLIQSDLRRG
jgi:glycosyltransferase involved in cell wall biosynthesis